MKLNVFKMVFIPMMAKLNFQHHYSCLQCHMILQKLFFNMLIWCSRKCFLLLSILKTVVLLNIFVET